MSDPVELVLFDLGGVLIEVRGVQAMQQLSGIDDAQELWRRWLACPWVRRFESGACSGPEFAAGLVADWQLELSPEALLDGFRGWATGELPGAVDLVAETRANVATSCFSNTNALHWWESLAALPLMRLFEQRFLSFELGLLKPDAAAFAAVADQLAVPRERVLFLDDNELNVQGAVDAGLRAACVRGVAEARARLVEFGVLDTTRVQSPSSLRRRAT